MRRLTLLPIFFAGLVSLAACGGKDNGGTPAAATTTAPVQPGQVTIANTAYNPPELTVKAGTQVTWSFEDNNLPHTVTADADSPLQFNSNQLSNGTFGVNFAKPGTYRYHCNLHSKMHGTITVT